MISSRRIIFRADGNSHIGLGHLIRSLALANILQADFECVFVIQEPDPDFLITLNKAGLKYFSLPASQQYLQEATELVKILHPSDLVVLDGYFFTTDYQLKIKDNGNKLVCLDDLHAFPFKADAVINQAGGVNPNLYQAEHYTKLCLGPAYALLREPFLKAAGNNREISKIKSILLNMGGADPENQTLHLLKSVLINQKNLVIKVVIGAAYSHKKELQGFVQNNTAISVHENLDADAMCRLMQSCEAAVLPPSSVSYEWCSVSGLLFLHQIADNQQDMASFLIRNGLAFPFVEFEQVLNHPEKEKLIAEQVKKQRAYFDGKSKHRLQGLFFDLVLPDALSLRKVQQQDMQLLFDWANDPEVRQHSFNPAPIALEMHERWFKAKLLDPDCFIFIAMAEAEPAGMIRFDINAQQATISYLLNKDFRGKGLGSWILTAGSEALHQHRPDVTRLIGQVQPSNMASVISFRKAGFTETKETLPTEPNSLLFAKSVI